MGRARRAALDLHLGLERNHQGRRMEGRRRSRACKKPWPPPHLGRTGGQRLSPVTRLPRTTIDCPRSPIDDGQVRLLPVSLNPLFPPVLAPSALCVEPECTSVVQKSRFVFFVTSSFSHGRRLEQWLAREVWSRGPCPLPVFHHRVSAKGGTGPEIGGGTHVEVRWRFQRPCCA